MAKKAKNKAEKRPNKNKTKKPKSSQSYSLPALLRRATQWGMKWGFVAAVWGVVILALTVFIYAYNLPDIHEAMKIDRRPTITIIDQQGIAVARYGQAQGDMVPIEKIPPDLIHAVIAIEDRRFYSHFGIDPLGILRASIANIRAGRVVQGGSTITQQLAKNLFLTHERTFRRKIEELLVAIWLEAKYSKDDILVAYLNRVYLGSGNYGVEAAAQDYFGKPVTDINLQEAALLAGLLKAPSRYSPKRNANRARNRARTVLNAMQQTNYITANDITLPRPRQPDDLQQESQAIQRPYARYFADWIMDQVPSFIGLYNDDLIVETTFNADLQKIAHDTISEQLRQSGTELAVSQGAALIIDQYGAVLAMVGGRNYSQSQFNRTTQAQRPVGSAFKPDLYLTALESGHYKTNSMVEDAPIRAGDYRPENFDREFRGWVRFDDALIDSLNTPAVRILQRVGLSRTIETARRLGVTAPLANDLSLALGSSGISMLEMTALYASLANGGHAVQPYGVLSIRNTRGDILYQRANNQQAVRLVAQNHADTMKELLLHTVRRGTGGRAQLEAFPTYGKTGTSQDYRDAWFIGWSSPLVAAIWYGNDNNSPMKGVTGGTLPATSFNKILESYFEQTNHHTATEEESSDNFVNRILRNLFQD